jgi:hypothetical protein
MAGKDDNSPTSSPEFEDPEGGQPPGGGDQGFATPSAAELGADVAESEAAAFEAELGGDLVSLKGEIERKLSADVSATADAAVAAQEVGGANIVGVGYGHADPASADRGLAMNAAPGGLGLVVFTIEPVEMSRVVSEVSAAAGTRALSSVPMVQIPVGVVDALPHRFRMRPAPGGISVGHFNITAGTLGCLAVGLNAPRNGRLMILSNNHVLANSNNASLGDCICQPGPADGGRCPQDQIAILEKFIPINFSGGVNFVDCATGWAWPDRVRRELVYLSGGSPVFFRVGSSPVAPAVGMTVGKSGRTTQLRMGRVTAINVSVNVNFAGRIGHFRDQISIVGTSGDFSAGGDSGSLVWQWATGLAPVGLLFAGGGGTTFANRIPRVLSALDIRIHN